MSPPTFLEAKLQPASTEAWQLERPRICDQVIQAPGLRLVLVRAPAGYGKTTAMVQMRRALERAGRSTVWLTLDAADNDVPRFLEGFNRCVLRLPGLHDGAGEVLQEAPAAVRLAQCTQPFAIFLDELELVTGAEVLGWIDQMIEQLPSHGQVIIGTRIQPDLRLARWRARRQMAEIDLATLRFSRSETVALLRVQGHAELDEADLARLHRATEGWVAGLWLASMALERHAAKAAFIARLAEADVVVDYLMEEVFLQQRPAVQAFLLRTSILKILMPTLCSVLVPEVDCDAMLRQLSHDNAMLVPIDAGAGGYRYHSLFSGFLQAQLRRREGGAVAGLHRQAARWFSEQGQPVPAMEHYLAAEDATAVIDLLSQHVLPLLSQGRVRPLMRLFESLPAALLDARPALRAAEAWALCLTRGPAAALQCLAAHRLEDSEDPQVWPLVAALRPCAMAMMGRYEDALALGQVAQARFPSGLSMADGALANVMANASMVKGLSPALSQALLRQATRSTSGGTLNSMYGLTIEGVADWLEGRTPEAHARFRLALTQSCGGDAHLSFGNAWPGLLCAATSYERNDVPHALALIRAYLPIVREIGLPDHLIMGYRMLSRVAFDRGDVDECLRCLAELEELGHRRLLFRVIASARLERARVQLLQMRVRESEDELARANDLDVWKSVARQRLLANDTEDLLLGRLRWDALAGNAQRAAQQLSRAAAEAAAARRHRRELALRLIQALALARHEGPDAAASCLAQVLRRLPAAGVSRLVLDEGPPMMAVVARLGQSLAQDQDALALSVRALLAAFRADVGPLPPDLASAASLDELALKSVPVEPLTAKELEVLRLLADGLSNAAIAGKLSVSDSTARTHLRHISAKLCVSNRTQAVSVGRRLGLVR